MFRIFGCMKKMCLYLLLLFFISCNKEANLPEQYYGSWSAESPQFLTYDMRVHVLILNKTSKSQYYSDGQSKLLDKNTKGWARIENDILYVGSSEFEINSYPTSTAEGYEMELNNLTYTRE